MSVPAQTPGFGTEYVENYCWGREHNAATAQNLEGSGLFNGTTKSFPVGAQPHPSMVVPGPAAEFHSTEYPSIYRETEVRKDDQGRQYTNPYKDYAQKEYGRRLIYDPDHPDKMYGSQWSSELADPNGCYSFPQTGLNPEVPWTKDMGWRMEGQEAQWPTEQWKQWTKVAMCPPYDGHTDQLEYSKFKVPHH